MANDNNTAKKKDETRGRNNNIESLCVCGCNKSTKCQRGVPPNKRNHQQQQQNVMNRQLFEEECKLTTAKKLEFHFQQNIQIETQGVFTQISCMKSRPNYCEKKRNRKRVKLNNVNMENSLIYSLGRHFGWTQSCKLIKKSVKNEMCLVRVFVIMMSCPFTRNYKKKDFPVSIIITCSSIPLKIKIKQFDKSVSFKAQKEY